MRLAVQILVNLLAYLLRLLRIQVQRYVNMENMDFIYYLK